MNYTPAACIRQLGKCTINGRKLNKTDANCTSKMAKAFKRAKKHGKYTTDREKEYSYIQNGMHFGPMTGRILVRNTR